MGAESIPQTIWWQDGTVRLIDQSRLPLVGDVLSCNTHEGVVWAIEGMAIRGAPALGVAAAMGLALYAVNETKDVTDAEGFVAGMAQVANRINATRPTAVNLSWGSERVMGVAADNLDLSVEDLRQRVLDEALAIQEEDIARNKAIGAAGAELIEDGMQVMTHCNAGSLATAHWGTALGVIYSAQEAGRTPRVWVRETRPVLQGSRLTMWELMMAGVPCKLIADSVAPMLMRAGAVDMVIVGADRIAANGDVANKIGTYGLAVLAKVHEIPFYVAAPSSTVDLTSPTGENIAIEERDPREVAGFTASADFTPVGEEAASALNALAGEAPYEFPLRLGSELMLSAKERSDEWFANELKPDTAGGAFQFDGHWRMTPQGADVFNPAFDITSCELITGIITENGIASPPFEESLAEAVEGTGSLHELKKAPEPQE